MSTIAAVLSLHYAKSMVAPKQVSYAPKLPKLFWKAKKSISNFANKPVKNATN